MMIPPLVLSFFLFCFIIVPGLEPSPSPPPEHFPVAPSVQTPSPSPGPESNGSLGHLSSPPSPAPGDGGGWSEGPSLAPGSTEDEFSGGAPPGATEVESDTVRWCTVREEYMDCQRLIRVLDHSYGYTWKCVQKDTTLDCLNCIKNGESDIITLEAGLAYTAFTNFSMKAIAHEIYRDRSKSYDSVAIVSRESCTRNKKQNILALSDFRGQRSCHGQYSSASGWNYPISFIKSLLDAQETDFLTDKETAARFFSGGVCAPSDLEPGSSVDNECGLNGLYFGDLGAFRCLIEGVGDIAFVRGDTVVMYSIEGPYNQSWSTKSIRDFMYLCPDGGCREINGYPGSCSFGGVPADMIMARNSLPNEMRQLILRTLTDLSLVKSILYSRGANHSRLFNPGVQAISANMELTRSYLGESASISQSILEAANPKANNLSSNYAFNVRSSLLTELLCIVAAVFLTKLAAN